MEFWNFGILEFWFVHVCTRLYTFVHLQSLIIYFSVTMASLNSSLDSSNMNFSLDVSQLDLSIGSISFDTELSVLRDISSAAGSLVCSRCDDTKALLKLYRDVYANEKKLQDGSLLVADYDVESAVKVFWQDTETVWDGRLKAINSVRFTCTVVFDVQGDGGLVEEEATDMPLAWIIVEP